MITMLTPIVCIALREYKKHPKNYGHLLINLLTNLHTLKIGDRIKKTPLDPIKTYLTIPKKHACHLSGKFFGITKNMSDKAVHISTDQLVVPSVLTVQYSFKCHLSFALN